MRLVADSGLWSTGQQGAQSQLVAVLEVSGAVLSWTVDDAAHAAQITFTDPDRADWLWRVLGEPGHVALAAALDGRTPGAPIDLTDVNLRPESLEPLRRLARQPRMAGADRGHSQDWVCLPQCRSPAVARPPGSCSCDKSRHSGA